MGFPSSRGVMRGARPERTPGPGAAAFVLARLRKVCEALRASPRGEDLKRCVARLPAGDEGILMRAQSTVGAG